MPMRRAHRVLAAVTAVVLVGGALAYVLASRRTSGPPDLRGFARAEVRAADGAVISVLSIGAGPGLVVVPGAMATAADYADLARELSGRYAVHVMDRRGHGGSSPQDDGYRVDQDVADVSAVLDATGSHLVVGHSYGGLVALQAALTDSAVTDVAVYEPGVSVDGSIDTAWFGPARRAVAEGRDLDALVDFVQGTSPGARGTPDWLLKAILPVAITKDVREQMYHLMPTAIREHAEAARLDGTWPRYAAVTARVLLMRGAQSDNGEREAARLATVIPHVSALVLPGLDHFGPDRTGPAPVARALITFLDHR